MLKIKNSNVWFLCWIILVVAFVTFKVYPKIYCSIQPSHRKKSGIQIKSIRFHTIRHRLKIIITYHSYSSGNIETVSYVWIDKESSLRWGLVSSSQVKYYTSSRSCGSKWVHVPTLITCILTSWLLTSYLFFIKYTQYVMSLFQPIKLFTIVTRFYQFFENPHFTKNFVHFILKIHFITKVQCVVFLYNVLIFNLENYNW